MNSYTDEELKAFRDKYFTGPLRKGFDVCDGYTVSAHFLEIKEEIENFEVFDDDVWVCTFAKCGTTWTQEMVWCICNNLDFEGAKVDLDLRFPFLELESVFYAEHLEYQPKFIRHSVQYTKELKRPRFIKTHLPWQLLPKQIRTYEKRPKIIFVARNPMDTCVSLYYHTKLFYGYEGKFEPFAQLFLKNKQLWTPYDDFLLDYFNRRNEPNILFLKFEELKSELPKVVDAVADFLKVTLPTSGKQKLLEHISFDSMKKNKAVSHDLLLKFLETNKLKYNKTQDFIRSGKSGGYRKEMSHEMIEVFKKRFMEKLEQAGLMFHV